MCSFTELFSFFLSSRVDAPSILQLPTRDGESQGQHGVLQLSWEGKCVYVCVCVGDVCGYVIFCICIFYLHPPE